MSWLMENPVAIIGAVVCVEFALAAALFRSGKVWVLGVMALTAVFGFGLLFAERLIVTDREAIRNTLDAGAHALLTNDVNKVYPYIAPDATALRDKARSVMSQLSFREARVAGDVEIEIHGDQTPPTATAKFFARAAIREGSRGSLAGMPAEAVERVVAELRKDDGRWLITDAHGKDGRF